MLTAARFVFLWWPGVALAACSGPGADRGPQNRGAEVGPGTPAVVTGGARAACDTAPHDPARYLTLNPGRLRIEAPTEWRMSENSATEIAFSVPAVSDPAPLDQPGSRWRFEKNVVLEHPKEGSLVLDVLQGARIGGVEFLKRL
jgi:hypothetical protein